MSDYQAEPTCKQTGGDIFTMRRVIILLALFISTGQAHSATVADVLSVRAQEINECRSSELLSWGDGRDRPAGSALLKFSYNHQGAPDWFSADLASGMVAKAATAWAACGIETQMVAGNSAGGKQRDTIMIRWDEKESGGNFAQANFTRKTLNLSAKAFGLLKKVNPAYDSRETLQMVIAHEMGHLFGLMAHSKRCIDVLSYYDNGKGGACYSRDATWKTRAVEYRSTLPTACDIERCRKINGKPPLASLLNFQ